MSVSEGLHALTGDGFFLWLAQDLATALGVAFAFVTELAADRQRFHSLAVWGRGRRMPDFDVPLVGTPCEAVLAGALEHHPDGVQQRFPADRVLVDWNVVSYAGAPILGARGYVVGHVAVLDDRPMPDATRAFDLLRVFALRARAEIERLQAEAALVASEARLRDSEARFRDLYEQAPLSYMTFDLDGRITGWNARAREITGCDDAVLPTMHVPDFLVDSPPTRELIARLGTDVLRDGRDMVAEVECRRANGVVYWARCAITPLRDAAGSIVGGRSIAQDITAERAAEQAIRDSQSRLAAILDAAMDAVIAFEPSGRIVQWNRTAETIFRCSAAAALATSLQRFTTPAAWEWLARARRELDAGRVHVTSEPGLTARRADGEEFACEAAAARVETGGGVLYTLMLRDVEERRRLAQQTAYLQEEIRAAHNVEEIVGQSPRWLEVLRRVGLVAPTDSTVLVAGETGTGKELVARAIHARSGRADRPLVKVNCAALPAGLIESELFGHERGAFTGATARRLGRFELAHGGTIFLDEVGELPLDVQAKLLRVLQEREFERVGGTATIAVDVRVIAATNRDLAQMAADGRFRSDLYYRLDVFPIAVPPLRERLDDLVPLVHYFVARCAARVGRRITRVAPAVFAALRDYAWPGNVRELEHVLERAVILSPGPELEVADALPAVARVRVDTPLVVAPAPAAAPAGDGPMALDAVERRHILQTLERTGWRIDGPRGAAQALGLPPSTLRSRMQKLGIQRGDRAS